ncbi:MAG TPA: hypothetical protein VFA56_12295 [Gaiellaceae bacterium]|nr:hypothetical protein [Gaiellaceae bacterium]
MHGTDPTLVPTLAAIVASMLMIRAGVAKRRLEWRPRNPRNRGDRRWR